MSIWAPSKILIWDGAQTLQSHHLLSFWCFTTCKSELVLVAVASGLRISSDGAPVGEGDRGRGGDNMLRIRHEIVDGSPDNCHRGTRVSIYLPPVLESHRQERAAMAREVAQNINWSLRAVFCCCSECLGLVCGPLGRALQASIQPVDFENISRILRSWKRERFLTDRSRP